MLAIDSTTNIITEELHRCGVVLTLAPPRGIPTPRMRVAAVVPRAGVRGGRWTRTDTATQIGTSRRVDIDIAHIGAGRDIRQRSRS